MTKQAEGELLDFLTSGENRSFVMDILRFEDQIRMRLLTEFWSDVHGCLDSHEDKPESSITSMRLALIPNKVPTSSAIYFWDESLKSAKHYLSYLLVMERGKHSVSIDFCVVGECAFKDAPNGLYTLPAVTELMERMESIDLGQPGKEYLSLGYKEIRSWDSLNELLAFFVHDKASILGEISETFWTFVNATIDLVQKANKALVEATVRSTALASGKRQEDK